MSKRLGNPSRCDLESLANSAVDLEPDFAHLGAQLGAYLAPEAQGPQVVPHGPVPLDFGFGVLKMFWSCFRSLLNLNLEPYVGRLLAPCWALGGSFFEALLAHKISSCFASVSEWFRSLSETQKLSSRLGENQILDLLHVLY